MIELGWQARRSRKARHGRCADSNVAAMGAKPYVWLASYPKSGNTWVRIFLHAYQCLLEGRREAFSLRNIEGNYLASRSLFDWLTGLDSGLLSPLAIAKCRSVALARNAADLAGPIPEIFKVHDCLWRVDATTLVVPEDCTRGVIYLVRNPVDVVASWAFHRQCSHADTVEFMGREDASMSISRERQTFNLPQRLSSWSQHAESWTTEHDMPLLVQRYEDLIADPAGSFARLVRFAGFELDPALLHEAIEMTTFSKLKAIENKEGFRELPKRSGVPAFFRQGKAGRGRQELTSELHERVVADHGAMMRRFAYL